MSIGIISLSAFQGNPGVQMLGFTCALVTSASWLMLASIKSWPVSTTYSIVSALAGVGVALGGADSVQWGWNNGKGKSTGFARKMQPCFAFAMCTLLRCTPWIAIQTELAYMHLGVRRPTLFPASLISTSY